ncbi:MAG: TetR/AcrR family transcriptional regulator [Betaproteobacteria bacterium]|nr:TetR/AcrR family transcriptional regulator [Betaproteobacteria bacterium]
MALSKAVTSRKRAAPAPGAPRAQLQAPVRPQRAAKPAPAVTPAVAPVSFRDKQFALREQAILDAVNGQLATRGYEAMVLDDIAAEVGIAKGSLYKHFESKEALAAAAMTRLLERLLAQARALPADAPPIEQLKSLLRWALQERAAGRLPTLPSSNTSLQQALMGHRAYIDALSQLSDVVGGLIERAIKARQIASTLPVTAVMLSIYARSCDPSFDFLRATGAYSDADLIELMLRLCFEGLQPRPRA